jgi:uncharacterized protein (DUF1697 family)
LTVTHDWVALLRGINVGSRNRVPMAQLREALEAAGYGPVRTYIQSGNVLLTAPTEDRAELGTGLERIVSEAFGIKSAVVLRTFAEIADVAASHPFGPDTSSSHVVFLHRRPSTAAVRDLAALDIAPDRIEVAETDVFVHYPNGIQGARLSAAMLERTLGVPGTMRNWRTVAKLAELAGGR